jgi:hypothetical protein
VPTDPGRPPYESGTAAVRGGVTCLSEESNLVPPAPQAGALSVELQRRVGSQGSSPRRAPALEYPQWTDRDSNPEFLLARQV